MATGGSRKRHRRKVNPAESLIQRRAPQPARSGTSWTVQPNLVKNAQKAGSMMGQQKPKGLKSLVDFQKPQFNQFQFTDYRKRKRRV